MPDLESMMGRTCSVSGVADIDGAIAAVVVVAGVTASVDVIVVVEVASVSFNSKGFEVVRGSLRSLEEEDEIISLGASIDEELLISAGEDEGGEEEMLETSLVLLSVTEVPSMLYDGNDSLAKEGWVKLVGATVLENNQ